MPAKILLQELWKLDLAWDKPIPSHLADQYRDWIQQIPSLTSHPVPRRLSSSDLPVIFTSLHGFSDASQLAYGAAVYLRRIHADNSTHCTLLSSKSRVMPLKALTIPKAELQAALLLTKLLTYLASLIQVPIQDCYAWSDSQIVLHWLNKPPFKLQQFVLNRVKNITESLPASHWRYIRSRENPADLVSRGLPPQELLSSKLWWHGPPWLKLSPDSWPFLPLLGTPPTLPPPVSCLAVSCERDRQEMEFQTNLANRFSSFHCMTRAMGWIYRFLHNAQKNKTKRCVLPVLQSSEIRRAKTTILKLSQRESLAGVFSLIQQGKPLPRGHSLRHYLVDISQDGLLLVTSRVRKKTDESQPIHFILLSTKSRLTIILLKTLHQTYGHPGISAFASILGHTYCIPGLRNTLKKISRSCSNCQRAYGQTLTTQMGLLPSIRTTPAPPFVNVGIDFAGPFTLRQGYTRKPVLIKCYVVIFVCMFTKCVHLDVCASLSTEDFLATLKRFTSRRGVPAHVFSDNGTNFQGARENIRELQTLMESTATLSAISHFSTHHDIQWHHIPPRTPHFGGLWESAVKSMKVLLRENLGPYPLRYDELYTLITEAEAILNSRPLLPLQSDDVTDGSYLTAGHFLIGRPLLAPPSPAAPQGQLRLLRRWNLVTRLMADLWKQWLGSYLSSLAARTKWQRPGRQLQVGDLVFLKDETLVVRQWPVALITATYPGDDQQTRVVEVRCRGHTYRRATNRLIPLLREDETPYTSATSSQDEAPRPRSMSRTLLDNWHRLALAKEQ